MTVFLFLFLRANFRAVNSHQKFQQLAHRNFIERKLDINVTTGNFFIFLLVFSIREENTDKKTNVLYNKRFYLIL